jgi:hypothetical protein
MRDSKKILPHKKEQKIEWKKSIKNYKLNTT